MNYSTTHRMGISPLFEKYQDPCFSFAIFLIVEGVGRDPPLCVFHTQIQTGCLSLLLSLPSVCCYFSGIWQQGFKHQKRLYPCSSLRS